MQTAVDQLGRAEVDQLGRSHPPITPPPRWTSLAGLQVDLIPQAATIPGGQFRAARGPRFGDGIPHSLHHALLIVAGNAVPRSSAGRLQWSSVDNQAAFCEVEAPDDEELDEPDHTA